MDKVIIIVNAEVQTSEKISKFSPVTEKMVNALKKAIPETFKVEVVAAASLWSKIDSLKTDRQKPIYCPLTIQLPNWIDFPQKTVYQACRDIQGRRNWVEEKLAYQTSVGHSGLGDLWLPIVWTAKGPLYGEVIGEREVPNFYEQPINLDYEHRQSLYYLAYHLLDALSAPPSVYLLQFSLRGEIVFDRLWPFPATPAIASIGIQQPDLYTCHWQCLTYQPILDLAIAT